MPKPYPCEFRDDREEPRTRSHDRADEVAVEGKLAARVHGLKFVRDDEELFDQLRGASGSASRSCTCLPPSIWWCPACSCLSKRGVDTRDCVPGSVSTSGAERGSCHLGGEVIGGRWSVIAVNVEIGR